MKKTVLITGASTGIGKEAALLFQRMGWQVSATMRSPEKEQDLKGLGNVICPKLDVMDPSSIENAIRETIDRFKTIDVIVNNAGYGLVGPFESSSREQIERQFGTNVFGLFEVTRQALPHLREQSEGVIINVASVGGRLTFPFYSLYHATKWCVEGFSESLSHELKKLGVRVKVVEPGPIKTDFYTRSMDVMDLSQFPMYDEPYKRSTKNIDGFLKYLGSSPEAVAKVIYKAATDGRSKLRYPAGWLAFPMLFFRKILPSGWFNAITRVSILR